MYRLVLVLILLVLSSCSNRLLIREHGSLEVTNYKEELIPYPITTTQYRDTDGDGDLDPVSNTHIQLVEKVTILYVFTTTRGVPLEYKEVRGGVPVWISNIYFVPVINKSYKEKEVNVVAEIDITNEPKVVSVKK